MRRYSATIIFFFLALQNAFASRTISGEIVDHKNQVLTGITIIARGANAEQRTTSDETGRFAFSVPDEDISLRIEGPYIKTQEKTVAVSSTTENIRIEAEYRIPPVHQELVIIASALEPQVETRSDEIYKRTLF